jgi:SPP1 gp7 family putative phage head morphogenesis protein
MKKRSMSSHDYWKAREENNLRHYEEQEQGYNRKVDDLYQAMIDECNRDIEAFYAKYAKDEGITLAEAKKRAAKLDIEAYGRKAKRYVKEKNFSPQANEEMKLYNMTMKVNRLELLKSELSLEMTACADATDKYYSEIFDERAREAYERQAGVLGMTVPDEKTMDRMADNLVHGSFQNSTIDGSYTTFSERIWVNQDALRSAVLTELTRGMIRGLNPRELARSLDKKMKAGRYNAERLMRTELARVQIGAQQQAISDAGYDSYEFIATEGARTCDVCRSLDGKKFKLRKMVVGENAPPMHPFCRCSVCAAMSDEEFKELTGVDPVKMDLKAINQAAVEKYKAKSENPIQTGGKEYQS